MTIWGKKQLAGEFTAEKAGYNFWNVTNGAEEYTVVRSRMPEGLTVFDSTHEPVSAVSQVGQQVCAAVRQR